MKILIENDEFAFVQFPDEFHALGVMASLATMSKMYGSERVFTFVERAHSHITTKNYGILMIKGKPDAVVLVPVGFILWAKLSKPTEIIFAERFRPLMPQELSSGPNLWMIDVAAPLGHLKELLAMFGAQHPDNKEYFGTRWTGKRWRVAKWPNKAAKEE